MKVNDAIVKTMADVYEDTEIKLRQALKDNYDFVGVKCTIEIDKILINYGLYKGEILDGENYDEVYNLIEYRRKMKDLE